MKHNQKFDMINSNHFLSGTTKQYDDLDHTCSHRLTHTVTTIEKFDNCFHITLNIVHMSTSVN